MEDKISLAGNWLHKAESDLRNAELILEINAENKPFDTVCFHCQQAVEKYLKGLMVFLDIPVMKTHNIEVLIDIISDKLPDIELLQEATCLTFYAVENRYPDDFVEVEGEEAVDAKYIADRVKAYVLEKMH